MFVRRYGHHWDEFPRSRPVARLGFQQIALRRNLCPRCSFLGAFRNSAPSCGKNHQSRKTRVGSTRRFDRRLVCTKNMCYCILRTPAQRVHEAKCSVVGHAARVHPKVAHQIHNQEMITHAPYNHQPNSLRANGRYELFHRFWCESCRTSQRFTHSRQHGHPNCHGWTICPDSI